MTDPRITHPHDRFMKELLAYPEQAGALLRERLPEAVVEFLSAKPPELVPDSFVDKELRGYLTRLCLRPTRREFFVQPDLMGTLRCVHPTVNRGS